MHRIPLILLALLAGLLPSREALAEAKAPSSCAAAPASSLIVNAKDKGAKGDGKTDDTAAIQAAIDQVAGSGGTVFVPDGIYMIDAEGSHLKLQSNMTFKLAKDATLKAIPNGAKSYAILDIAGVSDVTVVGGTLAGERDQHQGKRGEGGMGLRILRGAERITVSGVTAKDMWGDGFYVKGAKDVKFCSVTADHNRRQGLSVIDAAQVLVTKSTFKNTSGTRPSAGIDMEPDRPEQKVTGARILESQFVDNAGAGIQLHGKKSTISDLEIHRNMFKGNRPIVLKGDYAALASAICGNRYVTQEAERSDGLYAFGDPVAMVHHDDGGIVTLNGTGSCGGEDKAAKDRVQAGSEPR